MLLATSVAACGITPKEEDYTAKIAATRAAKDDSFKNDPESPVAADKKAALLPLHTFPDRRKLRGAGHARARCRPRADPGADLDGQDPQHRARRRAEVLAPGPPMRLTAFIDVDFSTGQPAVRAVRGPDERQGNLCGRALHGARSDADRNLRGRLQRRLQPILLLQSRVRLPVSAEGNRLAVPVRAGEKANNPGTTTR